MEMIRTFHPVGQGAFYSEEFIQTDKVVFRVIYDCGCIHRQDDEHNAEKVVNAWIDRMGANKTVQYLFISHFDYDHVSLLRVLRVRKVHVQRVVLPLISREDALLLIGIYNVLNIEDQTNISQILVGLAGAADEGQLDVRSLFDGETKIIRVRPGMSDGQETSYDGKATVINSRSVFCEKLSIGGVKLLWRYVSFNYDDAAQRKVLISLLDDEDVGFGSSFDPSSLENFPVLMQKYERGKAFSKIKKIYDKLNGRINLNSQLVFSLPEKNGDWSIQTAVISNRTDKEGWHTEMSPTFLYRLPVCVQEAGHISPGCLYTGDTDLKQVSEEPWYRSYGGAIGTLQIPHHGSSHSFETNAFPSDVYFCPISCSVNCYYKHPHSDVVRWIEKKNKFVLRVTECQGFTQEICSRQAVV